MQRPYMRLVLDVAEHQPVATKGSCKDFSLCLIGARLKSLRMYFNLG